MRNGFKMLFVIFLMLFAQTRAVPTTANFVGITQNPEVFVAVITSQEKAIAYICDGQNLAQWYRGTLQAGGLFEARSTTGTTRITAQINSRSVQGMVSLEAGETLSFRAAEQVDTAQAAGQAAGLYRSDDNIDNQRWLGGWIVLPNGEQRGSIFGGGSTRPGRKLELRANFAGVDLPELGLIQPFRVTSEWLATLQ